MLNRMFIFLQNLFDGLNYKSGPSILCLEKITNFCIENIFTS